MILANPLIRFQTMDRVSGCCGFARCEAMVGLSDES
jgi:hypothetical protein